MMETLEQYDGQFVLWVNGFHNTFFDQFFWLISSKSFWIPFYLILAYLYYRRSTVFGALFFIFIAGLCVALADLISAQLIKETVMRYRPSHHLELSDHLHYYRMADGTEYRGGLYGFVSSHAANFAALLYFSFRALRSYGSWLAVLFVTIFILIGLSRIYLGVHYLSDVVAGGAVGLLVSYMIYHYFFARVLQKKK